jgi:hypothetical protein
MADNIYPVYTIASVCLVSTNYFARAVGKVPAFTPDGGAANISIEQLCCIEF